MVLGSSPSSRACIQMPDMLGCDVGATQMFNGDDDGDINHIMNFTQINNVLDVPDMNE